MEKKTVTIEELNDSLQYLETFMKGQDSSSLENPANGKQASEEGKEPGSTASEGGEQEPEDDELYAAHKKRMAAYIDKAMSHKGIMDKIKKGEPLPDEAFEDLEDDEPGAKEPGKGIEKGLQNELGQEQLDEIVKAKVNEALTAQKAESEEIIKGLQNQIEEQKGQIAQLQEQPVRKTIIKGADALTLKKALSGEKVDDKTVLSISLQKSKVSNVLFDAFENEKDEVVKGRLGDAITEFESTGSYISPEIAQIMEKKGYTFVK